nr:MAG TPA: hypothetical protein [Caudoviricetes sp.]
MIIFMGKLKSVLFEVGCALRMRMATLRIRLLSRLW